MLGAVGDLDHVPSLGLAERVMRALLRSAAPVVPTRALTAPPLHGAHVEADLSARPVDACAGGQRFIEVSEDHRPLFGSVSSSSPS
jgi:hypothetical protein